VRHRTTKLYDRRQDDISLDEIERIRDLKGVMTRMCANCPARETAAMLARSAI
jgi:hypothetical protein